MSRFIRLGNAQAFWGDRGDAALELLTQEPDLDYLTMDYLAEVSMSILAQQLVKDPSAGYPRDFVGVIKSLAGYWLAGGKCKLIANSGGLNPMGCAQACIEALQKVGCRSMKIGVVQGDDVLALIRSHPNESNDYCNLDSRKPIREVQDRLITANAYLGSQGIVDALQQGADIVITGRIADPSLVVGPCRFEFGWQANQWQQIAGATVAGHLIECGTHVTGGISTDWLSVPDAAHIGFPIIEVDSEGGCIVTKSERAGGHVTVDTVKEQLIYEISDPSRYLSPEVTVSFQKLRVEQVAVNRVAVSGAIGSPAPSTLKVSATYRDGYRAAGMLTIIGQNALAKARKCGQIVLQRLAESGATYRDTIVECLGACESISVPHDARVGDGVGSGLLEVVLRIGVESDSKESVERFTKAMIPMVTAGPQGTTGYAEGRPKLHDVFRYWPCLIESTKVPYQMTMLECGANLPSVASSLPSKAVAASSTPIKNVFADKSQSNPQMDLTSESVGGTAPSSHANSLARIAFGRSGDKGSGANVGILARTPEAYAWLLDWLTAERVAKYFEPVGIESVKRFEFEAIHGMNFQVNGILRRTLRNDAQGKALAQMLLAMKLPDQS